MNQITGKTIFLFILFFSVNLFASSTSKNSVSVEINTPLLYEGDTASFTIKVTSNNNDIVFPKIIKIDTYKISGISNSSSTSIINGSIDKIISKTYSFNPTKNITIPSYKIIIDGNTYKTKEKNISVIKPTLSKKGDDYIVKLKIEKPTLKVGQSTILSVIFKRKLDAKADKLGLNEPIIENFWVKKIDNIKRYTQDNYIIQEFKYLIFAQKSGSFNIPKIEGQIGTLVQNYYGMQIKWKKVYSNSLDIKVEPLPNDIELYGQFNLKAKVDKITTNINQPINLTIFIEGYGNIDDIKPFELSLQNTMIYPDKPTITTKLLNDKYTGKFIQKIAIVGDKDFIIPPFKLQYFDSITKTIQTIQTKPISIKVKGAIASTSKPKLEISQHDNVMKQKTKIVYKEINNNQNYIYLIVGLLIGLFIGVVITYIMLKISTQKKKVLKEENKLVVSIKKSKNDKELYEILVPYINEYKELKAILNKLEENIYKQKNHKISKQELYDLVL